MAPILRDTDKLERGMVAAGYDPASRNAYIKHAREAAVPPSGSGASAATDLPAYLGIGIGVGGFFVLAFIAMIILTIRKRAEHKRMIEAIEVEQAVQAAQTQEFAEIPRPVTAPRCSALGPMHARAGWGALSSEESVHEPQVIEPVNKRKRTSISLPKKLKQGSIPLKRLKRLTAILESPRSKCSNSPALAVQPAMPPPATGVDTEAATQANSKAYNLRQAGEDDVFVCPGSPKPNVLPSFAIRSPGRYGADIANHNPPKAARSRSVGCMISIPDDAVLGQTSRISRPPMHARSISLGAPQTQPPTGPVPPLPIIAPHVPYDKDSVRQGVCISRVSSSSQESGHSSVLVASPILQIHEQNQPLRSPSVEEVIAQDDSASLKTVTTKQWQNPLVTGPRPRTATSRSQTSIRSNVARYSAESIASSRVSAASTTSADSKGKRLSVPHVGVADQVSISRVSSENSLSGIAGVQKITTPRKASRTSVSAYGSPAERKRPGILRDISNNSITLSRRASQTTQTSSRSSNGNPFQWDQPMPKPSAMKGSPNARKGHRRQNCVRISTLTPQILGPPPSRPTSPSIMHGIEEESGDGDEAATQPGVRFVSNQRPSRPVSSGSFASNLRMQPLRASLTPSSPTLSAWTQFQEHGLPSAHSDSQLSVSQFSASPATGTRSRLSQRSSAFSIPSFPSPIKATVANVQLQQPVPEFYLSRPSTDTLEEDSSSPFELKLSSDPEMPSSPPLPISKKQEYDPAHPAWPKVTIPVPKAQEYDPASPAWGSTGPERSSAFFPFATQPANHQSDDEVSPRSRPVSYGGKPPDTPPVSPKTMPEGFQAFFDKQDSGSKPARITEKLTSANASSIMARIPSTVDFPGAPILPPPEKPGDYSQTTPRSTPRKQRSVSNAAFLIPQRPAPPPPVPLSDGCVPSPLHISGKTSPQGPRSQPASSVLKNAMALRRMNSEMDNTINRESRRYVHLGREASPLLPWVGSPDPNESCADMNDLFDFDFASDTREGAEQEPSALDEIDMTEIERKLDGALAGFDAIPSDDTIRDQRSSSVWDDGEMYWEQQQHKAQLALIPSSPPSLDMTPQKQALNKALLATPKSIQNTPKSLYDSEGFLRT